MQQSGLPTDGVQRRRHRCPEPRSDWPGGSAESSQFPRYFGMGLLSNRAYAAAAAPLSENAVKAMPSNQTYRYDLDLTHQKLQNASRAKADWKGQLASIPNHMSQIKYARPLARTL